MTTIDELDHVAEFERAWNDPGATKTVFPTADINAILADHYIVGAPLTFTRTMLWDMETRKAAAPDRFIPTVVKPGSARAWGRRPAGEGCETLVRCSLQRLWLKPEEYELILEPVHLDHNRQTVTFIGVAELVDDRGDRLVAGTGQPLFHVEHSVGGEEERPTNEWRIVHLTDTPSQALIDRFESSAKEPWLREYVEIYIRDILNIELQRRESA